MPVWPTKVDERKKLERLCRYIARPAVSEKRLSLTPNGNVRYQLKTPYRESLPREQRECFGHGTTRVIFEPLDFIARLAALVPKPRVNLTRFHGLFAPNSQYRARVTPALRGKGNKARTADQGQDQAPAKRRAAMTWAQRLKRVFGIDIETCRECGGTVKVMPKALAALAGQALEKILTHLQEKLTPTPAGLRPASRAPPAELFG